MAIVTSCTLLHIDYCTCTSDTIIKSTALMAAFG